MSDYDIAIIGGGLNGVSIARDAAGRGLRVILLEQNDLGGAASAAASPLIHGDLAHLERRNWLRVRSALRERDRWLRNAPHLVRPMRFVIPSQANQRTSPRAALFWYDRLAPRAALPAAATLDLTHHPIGQPLQRPYGAAVEYSDGLADVSRLVVLMAVDAAERGADIRTGARCVRADRTEVWRLAMIDRGLRRSVTARALVNATGAWTASVIETVLRMPPRPLRLVKRSQIIVRRVFETDNVYVFRDDGQRLVYVTPHACDFMRIGTVEQDFVGDPAIVAASASEIAALCDAASRYFRKRIAPADVVGVLAGANAVDDSRSTTGAGEGHIELDRRNKHAPLLTVFGGNVTGMRRAAERAVSKLARFFPMSKPWTAKATLPGGDFAPEDFEKLIDRAEDRWPFLGEPQARRMVAAYGNRLADIVGDAASAADLGPVFGDDLTGAEVRYLIRKEYARFVDDILWRRSSRGLTMPASDREALAAFMAKP